MRKNKLVTSNILFLGAIPLLLLGGAIMLSPVVAHVFIHSNNLDPRLLGGGFMGLGVMECAYAVVLRLF